MGCDFYVVYPDSGGGRQAEPATPCQTDLAPNVVARLNTPRCGIVTSLTGHNATPQPVAAINVHSVPQAVALT